LLAVVYLTQAPLQSEKPELQANPHALVVHVARALATELAQAFAHDPQCPGSDVVSTHPPSQSVGASSGQVSPHSYVPAVGPVRHCATAPSTWDTHAMSHAPQ
jgi:hypothetical protein